MRNKVGEYGGSNPKSISAVVPSVRNMVNLKAVADRGQRRSEWVSYLYVELLSEVMRLKAAGAKFSPAPIVDNKIIVDKIKTRWRCMT